MFSSADPKATQWLVLSHVAVQSRNSRVALGGWAPPWTAGVATAASGGRLNRRGFWRCGGLLSLAGGQRQRKQGDGGDKPEAMRRHQGSHAF